MPRYAPNKMPGGLPFGQFFQHPVSDRADEVRGDVHVIHLAQVRADVEDQATDSRQQFARAQRPSPVAGSPFEQQEPQPVQSHRSSPMLALKAVQPF